MAKQRLKASDARKLAGPSVDEEVDVVLSHIEAAAKQGLREYVAKGKFWENNGTLAWNTARGILIDLGYSVRYHEYGDSSHFADPRTLIEWW